MTMKPIFSIAVLLYASAVVWLASPSPARAQGRQASVLDGVYSEAQAKRGQDEFGEKCSECHEGTESDHFGSADSTPSRLPPERVRARAEKIPGPMKTLHAK